MTSLSHPGPLRFISNADGAAILDIERGQIYTLNETGAFIWKQLQSRANINDIADRLAAETGGDPIQVQTEVQQFVATLVAKRIGPGVLGETV